MLLGIIFFFVLSIKSLLNRCIYNHLLLHMDLLLDLTVRFMMLHEWIIVLRCLLMSSMFALLLSQTLHDTLFRRRRLVGVHCRLHLWLLILVVVALKRSLWEKIGTTSFFHRLWRLINIYIVFLMVFGLGFLMLVVFVIDSNLELLVWIVATCELFSIVKLLLLLVILRF